MFKSSFRGRDYCLRDSASGRDSAVEEKRTTGMSSAFDEVDFDYATVIADRANRLMSEHAVPPPQTISPYGSIMRLARYRR
jgi:hypothetical protein